MGVEKYITPHVQAGEIKHRVTKWLGQVKGSTFDVFLQPEFYGDGRERYGERIQCEYNTILGVIDRIAAQRNYQFSYHYHPDFCYFTNNRFEFSDPYLEYRPYTIDQIMEQSNLLEIKDLINGEKLIGCILGHVNLNGYLSQVHHGFTECYPVANAISVVLQAGMYKDHPEPGITLRKPLKNTSQEVLYYPLWTVPVTAHRTFEMVQTHQTTFFGKLKFEDHLHCFSATVSGALIFDSLRGICIDTALTGSNIDESSYHVSSLGGFFRKSSSASSALEEKHKTRIHQDLAKFRGSI